MPWLKTSDRFATHPILLRLRSVVRADERTTNEVTGFVTRCSAQSACYLTDYYIDLGTAEIMGGARTELLLRQATAAGLLVLEGRGPTRRWKIVEDEDLFHIRAREDVEWERQRDRDRRNPDLTMPVLLRDGDQCRYCRCVVNWRDTRSGRGGTYDHREPGKPARVDTYVVCCRACNRKRADNPNADQDVPLLPAPPLPYFSPKSGTQKRLEDFYGRHIASASEQLRPAVDTAQSRPGTQPGTAPRPTTDTARPADATTGDTAAYAATSAGDPDHGGTTEEPPWSRGGRPVGTGRDGQGWAGAGADSAPPPFAPPAQPARRRGRGRRGR